MSHTSLSQKTSHPTPFSKVPIDIFYSFNSKELSFSNKIWIYSSILLNMNDMGGRCSKWKSWKSKTCFYSGHFGLILNIFIFSLWARMHLFFFGLHFLFFCRFSFISCYYQLSWACKKKKFAYFNFIFQQIANKW